VVQAPDVNVPRPNRNSLSDSCWCGCLRKDVGIWQRDQPSAGSNRLVLLPSNLSLSHEKYRKRSLADLTDENRSHLFAGQTTRLWLMQQSLAGVRLGFSLVADLSGMAARYGRARATAF
jgi:hypothetical protein